MPRADREVSAPPLLERGHDKVFPREETREPAPERLARRAHERRLRLLAARAAVPALPALLVLLHAPPLRAEVRVRRLEDLRLLLLLLFFRHRRRARRARQPPRPPLLLPARGVRRVPRRRRRRDDERGDRPRGVVRVQVLHRRRRHALERSAAELLRDAVEERPPPPWGRKGRRGRAELVRCGGSRVRAAQCLRHFLILLLRWRWRLNGDDGWLVVRRVKGRRGKGEGELRRARSLSWD